MTAQRSRTLLLFGTAATAASCGDDRDRLAELDSEAFVVTDDGVEWDDGWNNDRLAATVATILDRPVPLPWQWDDGGREAAGFTGDTGDCVTRAIAIATCLPYRDVYDDLAARYRAWATNPRRSRRQTHTPAGNRRTATPRDGVPRQVFDAWLADHGWVWHPKMTVGSGCQVHLAVGEIPATGPLVVRLSKHLAAVVDGVVYDNHDPGRDGTRCVYGWWAPPTTSAV